ncbi:MAG: hypothetical protein QY332_10640 [Anaerolineales bacterium]|nr:MAG: hypothetical protein QY332_10640 [Anaerolineales bacterium]
MTQQTGTVALAEEINAAFFPAEDDNVEIEPGELVEDHGDPPPFGETEQINELFAFCDVFD